ncbi:MAG: glucokinase [Anaerolineales bacterium]|nr:glucokinase [Anaerolineales bacterium]
MNAQSSHGYLLAGDIGATNTRLALFSDEDPYTPQHLAKFKGQAYPSLVDVLHEYLAEAPGPILGASLGVAGPVVAERVQLTNLAWAIDAAELRASFGWERIWLLNDLQAIASSVEQLGPADLHTLQVGQPELQGSRFVIAPGTGIGVSYLVWDGRRYRAYPTEGGHADFAPADAVQDELLAFLRGRYPQVHVEHVCSGLGIPNIYDFLLASGRAQAPGALAEQLAAAADRTPLIIDAALAGEPEGEICRQVLDIFVDALAAEAGSLALSYGSTGGAYIGGGIPPRILGEFERRGFAALFAAKTGYESYLARMPIQVILNTGAGLLGAAAHGWRELAEVPLA